jgi:putative methyltransferase (TIGR04325 family)
MLNGLSFQRGVFVNFSDAWKVAKRGRHAGHDHLDAIKLHFDLSRGLRASDYAVLYWLCRIGLRQLQIFDFGGNAGNLYYSYSTYLTGVGRDITWTVFDLPMVVAEGRRIAIERRATELRFAESVEDASGCNVLLISGAFHYWEDSVESFLEQFPRLPEHIIVNRSPVHDTEASFITVQRTDSYAVPCVVRNATEMINAFSSKGYRIADRWPVVELALRMPLFPNLTVPQYSGFYFRREG